GSVTASWRPAEGTTFAATLRHVGLQYEDDQQDDALPAATTVDLFAQVPLVDRLSFVGRVENLFDEEVITRNQGGSMDLGEPLTVWGGLRYGFWRRAGRPATSICRYRARPQRVTGGQKTKEERSWRPRLLPRKRCLPCAIRAPGRPIIGWPSRVPTKWLRR